MDIEEAVMQAMRAVGLDFNPSDVQIIGTDHGDSVHFSFVAQKPPLGTVLMEAQKALGDKFRGVVWYPSENVLEIFTTQSEPSDEM